jgi:hypothetical protein
MSALRQTRLAQCLVEAFSILLKGFAPRALFGRAIQPAAALKAMVYFEDGDLAALSRGDRSTLIAAASQVGVLPSVRLRSRSLAIPVRARRG